MAMEITDKEERPVELYYTPPTDEQFDEVRQGCIELWRQVDGDNDRYGYASSKINRILGIKNVGDNFMYMVAMFDNGNQARLAQKLSKSTRDAIRARLTDGGQPLYLIPF